MHSSYMLREGVGRRLCGTTWVTSNTDLTQNVHGKNAESWREDQGTSCSRIQSPVCCSCVLASARR